LLQLQVGVSIGAALQLTFNVKTVTEIFQQKSAMSTNANNYFAYMR
jgi:hypothetical protein